MRPSYGLKGRPYNTFWDILFYILQVEAVMSLLPRSVLRRGRAVTQSVLDHLKLSSIQNRHRHLHKHYSNVQYPNANIRTYDYS